MVTAGRLAARLLAGTVSKTVPAYAGTPPTDDSSEVS